MGASPEAEAEEEDENIVRISFAEELYKMWSVSLGWDSRWEHRVNGLEFKSQGMYISPVAHCVVKARGCFANCSER